MASSESPINSSNADTYEDDYAYYEQKKPKRPRRRLGEIVSTLVILLVIFLLLMLLFNPGFREAVTNAFAPAAGGYREYPEWADFEVERIITISQRIPSQPMDYQIDIPTPEDIGSNETLLQDVKQVQATPAPEDYDTKYGDYQWMLWNDSSVMSTRTFRIKYAIYTESAIWSMDSSDSGTLENYYPEWSGLVDKYGNKSRDEWKILPSDPHITVLSDQLTQGKVTVYDKLKAIFDYMNEKFEYETARQGEPKWCTETLEDQYGDCDDQSVLFISLARAAGLPCKLEFGALYNQQQDEWGGHAWIKVYIPLYTGDLYWYNIDIVNDHFLFRDAFRFSEWESDGNGTHLEDYYYSMGVNFKYEEMYYNLKMDKSSKTIRISETGRPMDETVPGFEGILVAPAVLIAALIVRRKKKDF
jgi:transglutaminase-like putative cysteine protease